MGEEGTIAVEGNMVFQWEHTCHLDKRGNYYYHALQCTLYCLRVLGSLINITQIAWYVAAAGAAVCGADKSRGNKVAIVS